MSERIDGGRGWFSRPVQGVLVIGALVVLLAVPITLIRDLILERQTARQDAVAEVTATWGGEQEIIGPRLVVPYRLPGGDGPDGVETGRVSFLPTTLDIGGSVTAESRARGFYTVPVYDAQLTLNGTFTAAEWDGSGLDADHLMWDEAVLVVEVSDSRAIGAGSTASWNGQALGLLPGGPEAAGGRRGVHAAVTLPPEGNVDFEVTLDVRGTEAIWFVPFSRATTVSLSSNWPHPSFAGAWLPEEHTVEARGFTADWEVPFLGRDYPQSWTSSSDPYESIVASRFGARLVSPVDHYRMSERSTKYAYLFLTLTFGLLWLFDTLACVRVHPIQYGLVGAAMCVFYLLELSLSEHIGFVAAYGVAALAIVSLIAAYAKAVLGSMYRGALMASATGLLYAYLFALLTLERYALLVGSLGLFSALATVMHLTRYVDWYQMPGRPAEGSD